MYEGSRTKDNVNGIGNSMHHDENGKSIIDGRDVVPGCSKEALEEMEKRLMSNMNQHLACVHWRTAALESSINAKFESLSRSISILLS